MKIVSHNAFWFQGTPFESDQPGAAVGDVLDGLIEIYRRLGPDLLCLQEVQTEEMFRQVAERLGMQGAHCPGTGLVQYGAAVLWKAGRVAADSRGAGRPVQRAWQIAEVPSGDGRAVRVANVHLPSGRQVGAEAAARSRCEEMAALLDGGEPPEVVVGDFNEDVGGPLGEVLTARGYLDAAEVTSRAELGTIRSGRRLDQIWVRETVRERVRGYGVVSEAAMRAAVAGKTHLSDHFPLWVEVAQRA